MKYLFRCSYSIVPDNITFTAKIRHDLNRYQLKKNLVAGPQACDLDHGVWTAPVMAKHINKKFGATYTSDSIYDLMERIGFSWQTPRSMNPKSASKKEQKEFKKKARQTVQYYMKKDT